MTDEEIRKYLKIGQDSKLYEIYDLYKSAFFHYVNRFGLPKDDVLDIYQDAFIASRENARKGKLDHLTSSVKTYFFAIGKYMVFSKLKQDQKTVHMASMNLIEDDVFAYEQEDEDNSDIMKIQAALEQVGGKCKELLTMFYYQGKKLDEIVLLMNYENKDVAKSQKSRCLKKIKGLLK